MSQIYDLSFIEPFYYTNLIFNTNPYPHTHKFWEFCIVLKGKSVNIMKNKSTILSQGDILLLRPHDEHSIKITERPYNHRDIYVSEEKMKRICQLFSPTLYDTFYSSPEPVLYSIPSLTLQTIKSDLNIFNSFNGVKNEYFENMHTAVIVSCLKEYFQSHMNNTALARTPIWIKDILTALDELENLSLSLDELLQNCHYSRTYICSQFKKYIGTTLKDYVNRQRAIYSLTLLRDRTLTIIDIAMMLGYNHPGNFITAFKRQYKMSPNRWRKENP